MTASSQKKFLDLLEQTGELVRIQAPVSTHLEIAEIADRFIKSPGHGPALLFEKPFNHNTGKLSAFPLAINVMGTDRRMALLLAADSVSERERQLEALLKTKPPEGFWEKIKMLPKLKEVAGIFPKAVHKAPCQEVVLTGDEIDIRSLPALHCWPDDGGSFITFGCTVTKDPENHIRNVGLYRLQIIDRQTTAMHWQIHKHGSGQFQRTKKMGKKMEVAVFVGGHPLLSFAAASPLPENVDEMLWAGYLRGEAIPMVKCKTVELEVPAEADFVLEGYVDPHEELLLEGPFGDHTGYYTPKDFYPKFHITALTHRHDAIYPTTIVGPPPMEDGAMGKAISRLFLPLIKMTFPEIRDMNLPIEACFHNLAIVSIRKDYPGHAQKIMHSLWGMGQLIFSKCIIVVDDDVDVQNLAEVVWRVSNNIDPKRDILFTDGPVDALDHAAPHFAFGSKMGIDATRKRADEGYKRQWPEVARMDAKTIERVNQQWNAWGLDQFLSLRF